MMFAFEQHGDPQTPTEEETNVGRKEEADNNGEVVAISGVHVAETDNVNSQVEGTEERMTGRRQAPVVPPRLGISIGTAAARGLPVISLQEAMFDDHAELPGGNVLRGEREEIRQRLWAERSRAIAACQEELACIDKKLAELNGQNESALPSIAKDRHTRPGERGA
jgi:hypothetical protein